MTAPKICIIDRVNGNLGRPIQAGFRRTGIQQPADIIYGDRDISPSGTPTSATTSPLGRDKAIWAGRIENLLYEGWSGLHSSEGHSQIPGRSPPQIPH